MSFNTGFIIGYAYTNAQIVEEFKCGNMGGMRRSKATNTLVIISDNTKPFYEDRWDGNVLYYTSMGKYGDQKLDSTQNKTLAESKTNDIGVHLFEVEKKAEYTYRGQVHLYAAPFEEDQKDENGELRKVWIFPLSVRPVVIEKKILDEKYAQRAKAARKLTEEQLREAAEARSTNIPSNRKTVSSTYIRDAYVAEYAKQRAHGICQLCGKEAPFIGADGTPYLESHHIIWLSQGGADTIENTVALCPNCHKKMHVLKLPEDVEKLVEARNSI